MSDSPVIFKRSKTKPGQRARQKSPDANDATSDFTPQGDESPITLASKLKNKAKRAKPKSRLSFGGDDDEVCVITVLGELILMGDGAMEGAGEVFQVKKSNLSQKLKLGTHPASHANLPSSLDQANISNGAPSYSAAYLSELKASTPSSRRPPRNDPYDADMSMDIGDISMQSVDDVFADNVSSIPSEASILNAKQKRERIRTTTASNNEDYISLSVIKRSDDNRGPHPESRLVREEDELGEGEDEFAEYTSAQERIPLGKKSKKVAASKLKETMQEMIADAEEEDDETMEWEQEQLRRGGHLVDENIERAPIKQVYKPASIPTSTPIPTLGPSITRLTQSLTLLTTSHASNVSSMSTLAEEREQLDKREAEMRDMVREAEGKRSWFVAFREWVESVATFLDEKFPQLEKLEDEHVSFLKERSDMISQRRRADDEDDLSLFLGFLPNPPQPDIAEVDELGRTVPGANPAVVRRDRITARAVRRSRRHATSTPWNQEDAEEGYSTDSSLPPSDQVDLGKALHELSTSARDILSDVRAEEFKNPSVGLGKWFGKWREKFRDIYTGAWGGLGLVGAWEFWVRLEIVGWNPIGDSKSLDDFRWYSSLYEYSRPPTEGDEEESELGPDGDLVSAMISTAIVPRLCRIVEGGAFDPYSAKDLRRTVDLAEQVEAHLEQNNQKFQMLLKSVYTVFANEVSFTESALAPYLSLNSPPFNPESIRARRRFLARRIKLIQNLLRWRKFTGERFGIGQLITKLVDRCIIPVAESGWDVGGEERTRQVVAILPPELVSPSLKVRLR